MTTLLAARAGEQRTVEARGDGLAYPLDQIDIAMAQGANPYVMCIGGDRVESDRWSLHTCGRDGFAAALAIDRPGRRLTSIRSWE
jgi:hypothetical protein